MRLLFSGNLSGVGGDGPGGKPLPSLQTEPHWRGKGMPPWGVPPSTHNVEHAVSCI